MTTPSTEQMRIAASLFPEAHSIYVEQFKIAKEEWQASIPFQKVLRKIKDPKERLEFLNRKVMEVAFLKTLCLAMAHLIQKQDGQTPSQSQPSQEETEGLLVGLLEL